jgi:PhnB protein
MPKKVDPLNKKTYGAVTAAITVSDIKAAVNFYSKALGFTKRGIMNGPDRKPIHAELTLRGTTLMLGPESAQMGNRTAKSIGGSPVTLYMTTESADKTVAKAVKMGATVKVPVGDMFWGDRCGTIVDPDGISWMIATHMADPTPQEMATKMKAMFAQNQAQAGSAASS